eukprot:GHRQ01027594.1.p1 GENE.GHRQ01027594.1~~GHRQ01027594.1.p1  ORF type:complete len:356 (+),score=94.09 GHRQ01027594.1:1008-2075(+)
MATTELAGHTDTVVSVAFNAAGSLLATGSLDSSVKVWRVPDGSCVQTLEGPADGIDWVAWHPKGDILLAGSEDFTMWMWLATTGSCMQVFSGHSGPVTAGAFTPDGKLIVSAGGENDCSLRVWNPKTGECSLTMHGALFHEDGITCLDVHQDGSVVITGGQDGAVRVTNIHNSRIVASLAGERDDGCAGLGLCVVAVMACPCSKRLQLRCAGAAAGCLQEVGALYSCRCDVKPHQLLSAILPVVQALFARFCHIAVRPGSLLLDLPGVPFGTARTQTGCVRSRCPAGHEESVEAVGFSRHLNLAATAGIDGKLIVWDCGAFSERGVCEHPEVSETAVYCPGSAPACAAHITPPCY